MNTTTDGAPQTKIAVIGGGSWATALVKIFCEQEVMVYWWMRNEADRKHITQYGHNPSYLSSAELEPTRLELCREVSDAVSNSDTVVIAIPAAYCKEVLEQLSADAFENKIVVTSIKGMMPEVNSLVSEYVQSRFSVANVCLAAIAGPCHAEEVAMERQSYLTVASPAKKTGRQVAELLECRFIKASVVTDLLGVEYCAVMKNIVAIASGIARGLNYGDNFQAVLVSNSMQEIKRFLKKVHKTKRNFTASVYLGDLLVTSYSQFSRNRTFGHMVGRGYSVRSAQVEMNMVAEGYTAVKSIMELNKVYQVYMPITSAVYHILYERISPVVEFKLLAAELK
jgi:glycerol-3-phosphate dehydrogenase (NAD(P)+)